jgi:hypothetical protein
MHQRLQHSFCKETKNVEPRLRKTFIAHSYSSLTATSHTSSEVVHGGCVLDTLEANIS